MATIQHPLIGNITGKLGDGVVQFLGIKYATLKDRLAESEILTQYDLENIDAIKTGPQVISPPDACDGEYRFIQQSLPHEIFEISELDGLHLNITVPNGKRENLPVFVFIHGGGFGVGSNAWPQYDLARVVKLSVDLGMPVIGVAINYRLGVQGFLTSAELQAAAYKANNGIRDQKTALRWIQKYIAGFGGDASNVTVVAQSAGGESYVVPVAATLHLQSGEPLFHQLVDMSGTLLALPPLPAEVAETTYSAVIKMLGLEKLSSKERIEKLLHAPISEFWTKVLPGVPLFPVIDSESVYPGPSYGKLSDGNEFKSAFPGAQWCRRLMVGDCQFDGSIYSMGLRARKAGIAKEFHNSISRTLQPYPQSVSAIEEAYDIKVDTPDDTALENILKFCTDIWFYMPAHIFSKGWPGASYLYHFNAGNPWDGPWKGEATHIMDVVYFFQNFNDHLPEGQLDAAKQFAKDIIKFINGQDPFQSHSDSNGAMVYGASKIDGSFIQNGLPADYGRRDALIKIAEHVGLDALSNAFRQFLIGS